MSVTIPSHLSNDELMTAVPRLVGDERVVTARLIAHLAEIDRRELYVPAGFASLYIYCREGLAALFRREVEEIVARLDPKPDVRSMVRKLPAPAVAVPEREVRETGHPALFGGSQADEEAAPAPRTTVTARRPVVAPLAPERYRVQFTIGKAAERKLRRLQELLKREIPDGDPAVIFDRALTVLLERVESRKHGVTARARTPKPIVPGPAAGSRHIPAAVRRSVVRRDVGRCAFVAVDGRRCTERAFIEYHHERAPYAHLPREIREARAAEEAGAS
jgi:hypothetical protein